MYCPKCAFSNDGTSEFCVKCGQPLRRQAAKPARTATEEMSPAAVPLVILSYMLAFVALVVFPPLFGLLSIGAATASYHMGNRSGGRTAIYVGTACMVLGFVIWGTIGGLSAAGASQ